MKILCDIITRHSLFIADFWLDSASQRSVSGGTGITCQSQIAARTLVLTGSISLSSSNNLQIDLSPGDTALLTVGTNWRGFMEFYPSLTAAKAELHLTAVQFIFNAWSL